MFDLLVDRDEHFETGPGRNRHQSTIPKLFPLHLSGGTDFMPRQVFAQSARQIMIEQNFHSYGLGRSSSR
jgi:hypothetical protein